VCWQRKKYAALPPDEQTRCLLAIVPENYICAKMKDLSEGLQVKLCGKHEGVLLWGPTGVGKTYAMAALIKQYIARGYCVQRLHYEKLCLQIRDTFNRNATETEWQILEPYLECDKLFIEDVGVGRSIGKQETDFSLRVFMLLLDLRMEECKPTYITSNKSVESLTSSFDSRVGDRLRTYEVIKLEGKSKRKEKSHGR